MTSELQRILIISFNLIYLGVLWLLVVAMTKKLGGDVVYHELAKLVELNQSNVDKMKMRMNTGHYGCKNKRLIKEYSFRKLLWCGKDEQ